jgi:hypothetical protein
MSDEELDWIESTLRSLNDAWVRITDDPPTRLEPEKVADAIAGLRAQIDIAMGALADIGNNTDMTRAQMQHKAKRICAELAAAERKA